MKSPRPNVVAIRNRGVYRLDLRGKVFERVLQTISNGKKTLDFETRAAAERKAAEVESLLVEYGAKKLETLESVLRIDPIDLQRRLDPYGKNIQEAVLFYENYLREQKDKGSSQTLGVLIDQWIAEKKKRVEQNTLRPTTFETLYFKVYGKDGYKSKWGNRPVASITTSEIKEWIESRKVALGESCFIAASQVSKSHQISYLRQFFHWCKKTHGTPKENPCADITIHRDRSGGVVYFTVDEAQKIMQESSTKRFVSLLPFHAISLFSGVRNAECKRLTWDSIDFEDKTIVIENDEAKTSGRRVEMQPNLVEWLTRFREKHPQYPLIPPSTQHKERAFHKLFESWPPNGMRHSNASYYLGAKLGGYANLEYNMGTSVRRPAGNRVVKWQSFLLRPAG